MAAIFSGKGFRSAPLDEQMDKMEWYLREVFELRGAGDGLVLVVSKGDELRTITTFSPDGLQTLLKALLASEQEATDQPFRH